MPKELKMKGLNYEKDNIMASLQSLAPRSIINGSSPSKKWIAAVVVPVSVVLIIIAIILIFAIRRCNRRKRKNADSQNSKLSLRKPPS